MRLERFRQAIPRPWHVAGVAAVLLGWWLAALQIGESRLPTPWQQVSALFDVVVYSPVLASQPGSPGHIWRDLGYTAARCLSGVFVGSVLGIVVGLVMAWSRNTRDVLDLPIETLRTIPPLAAIPFFLMWFGPAATTQFLLLVFFAFLRIVINTVEGVRSIPPYYSHFAMTMGATRGQVFRTVIWPALFPELVGAMRVILAASWGLQVVAELLGTPAGVGKVFLYLIPLLRPDLIIAVIFWVTVVAVIVDQFVFVPIARWVTRWVPRAE